MSRGVRGVILAGGQASRFGGQPKGLEEVGGARIVDRLAAMLHQVLGLPPFLVANDPGAAGWDTGLDIVADARPGTGTLGGIYTAVASAAPVVCVAWDMPFVPPGLVRALADGLSGADVVIPTSGGPRGLEPLCAAYGPACLAPMTRALDAGDYRAIAFHAGVRVLRLEPGDLPPAARPPEGIDPFFNVNTPDDLAEARALWPHFASSPSSGGRTPERPR